MLICANAAQLPLPDESVQCVVTSPPYWAVRGTHAGWRDEYLPSKRNMRNVWTFATQPYSGAHFATFPEEIPRRCILAATSAKGACLQCGAPWDRIIRVSGGTIGKSYIPHEGDEVTGKMPSIELRNEMLNGSYVRREIGWTPTCKCRGQHDRTRPCVVLDPFGGSGTTGRVAIELNRTPILVDLAYNAEYKDLAAQRTSQVQRNLL